jgi:hypothetical protein
MTDVIHRWEMSYRLQRLVNQHAGLPRAVQTSSCTPAEWGEQFRSDLERLGLCGRTRNAIVFWANLAVTEWQYDPSTERWYRPPMQGFFRSDAFQVRGELLSFDRWCHAVAQETISTSTLLWIRNFGHKSLEELRASIRRVFFCDPPNVEA